MSLGRILSLIFLSIGIFMASVSESAVIMLQDDQFNSSEWLNDPLVTSGKEIATTTLPGGIGAAGTGFHFTQIQGFSFQTDATYRAFHFWNPTEHNPATEGRIDSIHWLVWHKPILDNHVVRLIASQNESIYWSSESEFVSNHDEFPFWSSKQFPITPSSFSRVVGGGPANIDWSRTGAPITFGYVTYNDHPGIQRHDPIGVVGQIGIDLFTLTLTASPSSGDANSDGLVDATDLNTLALNWQQMVAGGDADADFNGDGVVGPADLNLLALNWQFGVTPQMSSSMEEAFTALTNRVIPEPASLSLLAVLVPMLVSRRRG